jgi:hypothetical protein
MVIIRSAHELLEAFRPLDLRLFELPPETAYPLPVHGYTAWVEHGGARVYLVFEDPETGRAQGIIFQRDSGSHGHVQMCDFCHFFGAQDEVGLLVAEVTRRKRVGVYVCRDLSCGDRLEEAGDRLGRDTRQEHRRLLERIARFSREALEIAPDAPAP